MEFSEKIDLKNGIKKAQEKLQEEPKIAQESGNVEKQNEIGAKIQENAVKLKDIEESIKNEINSKTEKEKMEQEANSFLEKGIGIDGKIQDVLASINDVNISDEDIDVAKELLVSLEKQKSRLKGEIYAAALQRAGLSYNDGEFSPTEIIKKRGGKIFELEAEIKDLQIKKKAIESKKIDINNQFEIAIQKYKQMLENGKITEELYEKRIANMNLAKAKDYESLDSSLNEINEKITTNKKEIKDNEEYIENLQSKFEIYDEYDKVYYKLFGEPLDKFAKQRAEIMKNGKKNDDKADIKIEIPVAKDDQNIVKPNNENKKEKSESGSNLNVNNEAQYVEVNGIEKSENVTEEPLDVVVTSKTKFNELYKKLSNGKISNKELEALTKVLIDKNNYDKYGITTGVIFNKARKILKIQGYNTSKNIDKFLEKFGDFSSDIKFDTSIEDENILSHDMLNTWNVVSKKLPSLTKTFSVEKYIKSIEKYKEEGNSLTESQEKIYEEAIKIKDVLGNYKKAVSINDIVTKDRNAKMHNSIFYTMFSNGFNNKKVALPIASEDSKFSKAMLSDEVLDLSSMVNDSYDELDRVCISDEKEKDMEESIR